MAGGMDLAGGARGGKKPLDTVINLVPFIDLMAVTIAFLMLTAVWTAAGVQPVASGGTGPGEPSAPPLTLHVSARRVTSALLDVPLAELPRLERSLRDASVRTATLEVDDDVSYDALVQVIDACRGARVDVTVSPASG
ncbi:MAG: biopolymer transporter ExbD [Archangiaceae bacterium]|nr:biopolymer transporter ExbD [Archangiaceae bacterium]